MADIDYGEFSSLVPGAKQTEQSQYGEFSTLVPKTSAMDDLATSAKKGVVGVGEAVVGVADLTSGGRAGKALQDAGLDLKGTQQSLSDNYSPEMKRQQQYVGEAQGFWDAARRAATSPRFAANAIVESIPSMVAGGVAGRGMQALGAGRAVASGMGEGLVMAGQHAEQNRQNNSQGLLDEKGYVESAIAGVGGAIIGAAGGKLDDVLGVWNPDSMFLKGARKAVEGKMLPRIGKGAAIEAGEEAGQSYVEQVGENYAKGKPLTEGAAEQAGVGGAIGGLMGAAGGVMPGHRKANADHPQDQQNDPAATVPVGPAQAAAEVAKASGAIQGAQAAGGDPGASQTPSAMGGVRGLIAEAAKRNGVDPATALTISAIETGGRFNADAANPKSSARGVFQFMEATRKMFPEVTPEQWQDPAVQAEYGAKFIAQTNQRLTQQLGREPTPSEAYMGHLLGAYGASSVLKADPNASVQDVIASYDPKRAAEIVRLNGMKDMTAGEAVQKWERIAQAAQARIGVESKAFPFSDKSGAELAARNAPAGQMLEVVEHPNVPGRFAALPPLAGDPNEEQPASKVPLIADLPRYDENPNGPQTTQAVQGPQEGLQAPATAGSGLLSSTGAEEATAGADPAAPAQVASSNGQPAILDRASGIVPATDGSLRAETGSGAGALDAAVGQGGVRATDAAPAPATREDLIAQRGLVPGQDYNGAPTPGQIEAGNYKKVHESWSGLPLTIENPVGSTRTAADGSWSVDMQADYGYLKRTVGADSKGGKPEQIDFYRPMNADPKAPVWVIDQIDPTTQHFDEHKVVFGVHTAEEAQSIYDQHFNDDSGPQRRALITQMAMPEFKAWIKGDTAMPASVAAPSVREQVAQKDGILPERFEAPTLDEAGIAQIPVKAWTPQVAKEEMPRLEKLNKSLGFDADTGIQPLRTAAPPNVALAQHVAEAAFGVKVVPVESNSAFDGAFFGDRAYIAPEEEHPVLAVTGHEVFHSIEKTDLGERLRDIAREWALDWKGQVEDRRLSESFESGKKVSSKYAQNEVVADLNGAMWMDPRFWSEMAVRDENLFRQVAYKFAEVATKAVQVVTGSRFDAGTMVKDVDTVRGLIAQAWADRAQGKLAGKPQPSAEVVASGPGITPATRQDNLDSFLADSVEKEPWYHGTARDITQFTPKQADAIFLARKPAISEDFAGASENWMAKNYLRELPAERIAAAKEQASADIEKAWNDGELNDEAIDMVEAIAADRAEENGMAWDYLEPRLREQMPTRQNIMPLHVRVTKPFDYENADHRSALVQKMGADLTTESRIKGGAWDVIESPKAIQAMKALGFDGFYVNEGGGKNLAVFDPAQVKSVTGNRGTFDTSNPDVRFSRKEDKGNLPTRVPSGKGMQAKLSEVQLADYAALQSEPEMFEKVVDLVSKHPGMQALVQDDPHTTAENIINRMAQNLQWLHDQVPQAMRERTKKWYEGARAIATRWTEVYDITSQQAAGVLAVLSPQKDWYLNVSLAERVLDITRDQQNHQFDPSMRAAAFKFLTQEFAKPEDKRKNLEAYRASNTKTLAEVVASGNERAIGVWIRAYDEAHHSARVSMVSPEGAFRGDSAERAWGDMKTIGKAVSVLRDGSPANISKQLGVEHKVRNFYNNILTPKDGRFVTIDTHAVAAAELMPYAASDAPVLENFGSQGASSRATGLSGTYALYHEAYQRAGKAVGLTGREMQSVTWEAVRGLYDANAKKGLREPVGNAWRAVDDGKMTVEEARAKIIEITGGVQAPTWLKADDAPLADKTYSRERNAAPQRQTIFEVAPDPRNAALKEKWDALASDRKWALSQEVAFEIAGKAMVGIANPQVFKGELHSQLGGFGDDSNPSLSIWFDKYASNLAIERLTNVLGYALNQQSMMRVSPTSFKGAIKGDAAVIEFPEEMSDDDLHQQYMLLRPLGFVEGHTTAAGRMAIILPEGTDAATAGAKIDAALGGKYDVSVSDIYFAFPEKGENDYGLQRTSPAGQSSGSEASLFTLGDQLRAEAQARLEEAVGLSQPRLLEKPAEEASAEEVEAVALSRKGIGAALSSITVPEIKGRIKGKWQDLRGIALQGLGGRQIAEVYGKDLPNLPLYQRLVQQMQAGVDDMAVKADQLVNEWGKLKDEKQLADLMHDATLAQVDPAKAYVTGDSQSHYDELRARFDKLSPEAQALYAKARDMYESHYSAVRDAIRERIDRAEGLSTQRKSEMLKRMDGQFFERVRGVYFPLARFGDFLVVVRDAEGKTVSVSREEDTYKAQAMRRDMMDKFPKGRGFTVSQVIKAAEFNARKASVGSDFLEGLFKVLDESGLGEALQDDINQLVLTAMPDLSWAKHGIHRKGTAGFSDDARRAFAQNMFHGVRYLQRVRFGDRLERELRNMEKYVEGRNEMTESIKEQQVVDEVRKRHDILMNPQSHPLATTLNSFGFLFHLGLSPATALVNLTQTAMVAYPMLGGKWGYTKAAAALTTASADTVKAKNDLGNLLKGDEKRAFEQAVADGTIDKTQVHDLAGIAQGEDSGLLWKMRPVMRWASVLFHHAERFNRQATFMAAYRLAREAGTAHDEAVEQASDYTIRSHFDYSAGNRPRAMQGNWQRVFLQFKQYSQNMTFALANNMRLSMGGDKQAQKTLAGLLVMAGSAAGMLGIPVVAQLLSFAGMLGGSDDEPWDAKVALQNYLADSLGHKTAEVMMHGLSRLGPADISGRVSLDLYKMWFPDVNEAAEGQRAYESFLTGMAGPVVGGIGGGAAKAIQAWGDGDYQRGLENVLPSLLRGFSKAERYAEEGVKDKGGVPIKESVSAAGIAAQALGFRPSEVANAQEGRGAIMGMDRRLQGRRSDLLEQYAKGAMSGSDTSDTLAAISAFNAANPHRIIAPMHLQQTVMTRQKRILQAQQGVSLPIKRRDTVAEGRFATDE